MSHIPLPLVVDADFFVSGHTENAASMQVGTPRWYTWLADKCHTSFAFQGRQGVFTARHERQRHNLYWYAYRKRDGKTYKTYLGKSEELTPERLSLVAGVLANKSIRSSIQSLQPAAHPLVARFSAPILPGAYVPRPRLIGCLEAGHRSKLIVISAPAGWGKTALLSEWCAKLARQQRLCVWVSLDAQAVDPGVFWTNFIMALQTIHPAIGVNALALLENSQVALETVIMTLQHELMLLTSDITLFLDDCQQLTAQTLNYALNFLFDNLPAGLHLVMASRIEPPVSLAKLRVQGQLLELGASDLAFTVPETCALLIDTLRLPLSQETCVQVTQRTEGWATGLRLATFAVQSDNRVSEIAAITGSERYILNYLLEEVVSKQSQAVQEFLLYTSVLTQLHGPLCDAVRGSTDSQTLLENILQLNMFIKLEKHTDSQYRYYQLFAEALRARLRQLHPGLELELHRRASLWYEQRGMLLEALSHARAAADERIIARLIKQREHKHTLALQSGNLSHIEQLTGRERDVLSLLVDGASNREIAQSLIISEGTVKKHVSNICSKLNVQRRTQVIMKAVALALL